MKTTLFVFAVTIAIVSSVLIAKPFADTDIGTLSGYIVVASSTTTGGEAGSSGTVALFNPAGKFVRLLRDLYMSTELPTGLLYVGSGNLLVSVDGQDRLELISALTGAYSLYTTTPGLTAAPLKQMTMDSYDNIYISEYNNNTIEKFSSDGTRIGMPFITGGGSCLLSGVWGIAYIPITNQIAAISHTNGRLAFFNAETGQCVTSISHAAYVTQEPAALAYHPQTKKLLITRVGDERIFAADHNGLNPITAYNNVSRVSDAYTIAVDANGFVYVGASTQDTIEKFSFDGVKLTPSSNGPIIGPSVFTQNPTQIVVIP